MNLRNKKTREVGYYLHTHRDCKTGALKVAVLKDGVPFSEFEPHEPIYDYDSLDKLNEEWEDYKLAEPLIKDSKIRKAVRAWAEANDIDDIVCFALEDGFEFAGNATGLDIRFNQSLGIDTDRRYTITELCGEEE